MSISTAQATALADGFLDDLGEEKSVLQPRETITELFLIAGELVEDAQKNLNQSNTNASGKLSTSILLSNPRQEGTKISVDISMLEYGQYINDGVKGTVSGTGKFSFKYSNPSRKQVANMLLGIRRARKKITNTNTRKSVSSNEKKNGALAELSHAWAAARKVKMYGIKPTNFMTKAIEVASQKTQDRLGAALIVDLNNSI